MGPSPSRYRIAIIALTVSTLVTSGSARAQSPEQDCPLAAVPASVDGLDLVGWEKYPEERLGSIFRYRARGRFAADVYVYPGWTSPEQELEQYKQTLDRGQQRGEYTSYQLLPDQQLAVPGSDVTGHLVTTVVEARDRLHRSYYYLYPFDSQRIKVRISHPDGAFTAESIEQFVNALLQELMRIGTAA